MSSQNFFAELKRRNVYKVAVAYAVVGWLLVQIATQVFPFLEIPNWAIRLVILLIAIGFPVALVLAWAFELTPEGVKHTEAAAPASRPHRAWIYIVVLAALASIAVFVFTRQHRGASDSAANRSIAVLPFEYLSEDKGNAYFADGIQDEILTRLSRINDLKVISRTSTQKYKSAPANLREIAQQLGVANVLEGSVQKAADQVRITVQLINATNDAHLWAETYDRKLVDVFQVESDVAQKIASTLEAKLTGKEKAAIETRGTDNPQAYETYLRALALNNSQADEDKAHMRDLLREAVQLDPKFADAWAWLAVTESSRYFFPEESPAQKERARLAADTVVRLAPDSPMAEAAMGAYQYYVEKNYDEALRWIDRARSSAPNDHRFIDLAALVKRRQGKIDETIALQKRAAELDPLNVNAWVELAWSYRGLRDLARTRDTLDRALAIAPNDPNITASKAETFMAAGDLETSWQMIRDLKFTAGDDGIGILITLLVERRDYDELARRIAQVSESRSPLFQALARGGTARLALVKGDRHAAEPLLREAVSLFVQLRERHEGGVIVYEQLMELNALLGHREEVERLAQQLHALRQMDKWTLPIAEENVARAYALLGDADRAIPLLDKVLHENYAGALTPAYLRYDLDYEPIRNDPRFQKLASEQM